MKHTEDLHQLIHSLNKNEKGYFKKYAFSHIQNKKNVYIRLFEALEKQTEYDEEKILSKFSGEKFLNNFSMAKNYLYNAILKSARSYHAESNSSIQLFSAIQNIEILYNKGLLKQCDKAIKKNKPLAVRYENDYLLFELLKWEEVINRELHRNISFDKFKENISEIQSQEKELVKKVQVIKKYKYIIESIFVQYLADGLPRGSKELELFEKNLQTLSSKEESMLPHEAAWYYYTSAGLLSTVKNETGKIYYYKKKALELVEKKEELILENPNRYIVAINNFLDILLLTEKYDEFFEVLKNMKTTLGKIKLPDLKKQTDAKVFEMSTSYELKYYIEKNEFSKINSLLPVIQKGLKEYEGKMRKSTTFQIYYGIGSMYLGLANYKQSAFWLNKIIHQADPDIRSDIQSFARIMNLINYYELKEEDALFYLVRSTYRFLLKKEKLFKVEKAVLSFLNRSYSIQENGMLKTAFKALHREIKVLTKDPFERKALDSFDILSWLESKINNKSFAEILKSKSRKI